MLRRETAALNGKGCGSDMNEDSPHKMADFVRQQYQGRAKDANFRIQMKLANASDKRRRMLAILFDDARQALEDLQVLDELKVQLGHQFSRRTFIRTMFPHIEALLSLLRQEIVTWHSLRAIKLT